jgi:hypothetical protein
LLNEPIFVGIPIGVSRRRTYDGDFLRREDARTKGILAISLLKGSSFLYGETDKKSEGVYAKNRGKLL